MCQVHCESVDLLMSSRSVMSRSWKASKKQSKKARKQESKESKESKSPPGTTIALGSFFGPPIGSSCGRHHTPQSSIFGFFLGSSYKGKGILTLVLVASTANGELDAEELSDAGIRWSEANDAAVERVVAAGDCCACCKSGVVPL